MVHSKIPIVRVKFWLTLLAATVLAACAAPAQGGLSAGDPAPDFTLDTASGTQVTLSSYQGQPVLLYFHMAVG